MEVKSLAKRKGVVVRRGLKKAWSKRASRCDVHVKGKRRIVPITYLVRSFQHFGTPLSKMLQGAIASRCSFLRDAVPERCFRFPAAAFLLGAHRHIRGTS